MNEKYMRIETKPNLTKKSSDNFSILFTSILLLAFFIAIYSLFYSGTFMTDDEHILASQSLSLAFDNHLDIARVIGNSRVYQFSLLPALQAIQAVNIEPAQTFFGSLLVKLSVLLGTGHVQTMFLLNIWVTAGTVAILYITACLTGYSRKTGLILAVLFGLGTMAFPYSRTYFRDPLAMFFLACAWLFERKIVRQAGKQIFTRSRLLLWLSFLAFSLAGILAKNTVLIAVLVMLFEILLSRLLTKKIRFNSADLLKISYITILALGLILFWLMVVPKISFLARFSPEYYRSIFNNIFGGNHQNLLLAIAGPFISPGKSIFLFSPVLLLALWCLIFRFRSSWSAWFYLILLVISEALFYDADWAGHVNWGLRYILPAIPPLIISSAPAIENLIEKAKGQLLLITMAGISFFVQLLGVLPPVRQYFIENNSAIPQITEYSSIWQPKQSILLWSMRWIFSGKYFDLAVWRNQGSLWLIVITIVIVGIFTNFTLKNKKFQWVSIISLAFVIGIDLVLLTFYRNDSAYYRDRIDLNNSQVYLNEHVQTNDIVFIKDYATPAWNYWMNWSNARIQWIALPYAFPSPLLVEKAIQTHKSVDAMDNDTLAILIKESYPGRKVWILLPEDSPGASLNLEIDWLRERSRNNDCINFNGENVITRLCWFEIDK
jgi:hypothetical protein